MIKRSRDGESFDVYLPALVSLSRQAVEEALALKLKAVETRQRERGNTFHQARVLQEKKK